VSQPNLITVQTNVVKDVLIGSLADAVATRLDEPLDGPVEAALAGACDERLQRLARAGYHARAVELERFEPARAPMLWLTARILDGLAGGAEWSEVAAHIAAELADREPSERPDPDSDAVSWKVPGPGGHVRHYLAVRTHAEHGIGHPAVAAKRAWLTGFLVHCCEEAAPPP
jgi:hypothetical protein